VSGHQRPPPKWARGLDVSLGFSRCARTRFSAADPLNEQHQSRCQPLQSQCPTGSCTASCTASCVHGCACIAQLHRKKSAKSGESISSCLFSLEI
jgi:hypothetical protein